VSGEAMVSKSTVPWPKAVAEQPARTNMTMTDFFMMIGWVEDLTSSEGSPKILKWLAAEGQAGETAHEAQGNCGGFGNRAGIRGRT
jgi:hypothetical protein